MKRFVDVPEPPVDAYQNLREIGALWELVASRPHARILEVGSLFGGTLHYWSHLPEIELLVAVDLPSSWEKVAEGVRVARASWEEWFSPRVRFVDVELDSRSLEARIAVADACEGEMIDFAFVDGDHSYEGVRADFEIWSPFVRPGGWVAFHDTWPNFDRHEPGVVRWCDELRHHLPSIEWTDPDGVGICAFELPS